MSPTVEQIKAWRARHKLTAREAGYILGVSNYRRHVSPNPQKLPAPNWFMGCAWSVLPSVEWDAIRDYSESDGAPWISGQSTGVRFLVTALSMLQTKQFVKIGKEMIDE